MLLDEALILLDRIDCSPEDDARIDQIGDELRRLHNEVESLRADAARYRWLRADAERFRFLQSIDPVEAQAYFWNWKGKDNRAAAIDREIQLLKEQK